MKGHLVRFPGIVKMNELKMGADPLNPFLALRNVNNTESNDSRFQREIRKR